MRVTWSHQVAERTYISTQHGARIGRAKKSAEFSRDTYTYEKDTQSV